jgi:hypothetical protein
MGIEVQPDHMAVIVQELVAADAAGVIFTADPNTGNPWHFVLSSTFALAQNVMNSTAPADSFVLEWDTSKIISKRIVEKPTMLIPGKAGIKRAQLSSERGKDASLSDAMAQRISDMALSLDRLFNLRVDVEWVVLGEDIYLIQVRPLTALPEFFPISLSEEDMKLHWGYEPNDGSDNSSLATGTDIPYEPFFRDFYTSEMDTRYVFYGDVALAHFEEKVIEIHGYQFISGWKYVPPSLDRHSFEKWLYDNEPKLKASWLKAKQRMQESANLAAEAIKNTRSAADIIPYLLKMRELYWDATAANLGLSHMLYHSCHDLLLHFVDEVAPDFFADGLLQGLISYSHEHAQAAYKLGQNISEDFVKDAFVEYDFDEIIPYLLENHRECRFLKDYEEFCWRFGLRPPNWSIRAARWARFQEGIVFQGLPIIKNALLGRSRNPEEVFRDAVHRREANEQEIRRLIPERESSQLQRLNKLLDWAQFWTAALDDLTWIMILHHSLFELVWETGVRLHKEGLIDKPEETLLFTVADLEQIQKSKEPKGHSTIYEQRKLEYEMDCRLKPPSFIGVPPEKPKDEYSASEEPTIASRKSPEQAKVLVGVGHTPGRVTGMSLKAKNVANPNLLDLLSNEHILVCLGGIHMITDWFSLLLVARGLVVDEECGANLWHARNISRECGVVMISLEHEDAVGIPDNTKIALDGKTGTITICDTI